MFKGCSSLTGPTNIDLWDVSAIEDLSSMFYLTSSFNQPIGSWNVSAVDTFQSMFSAATSFNQNLGAWSLRLAGVTMTSMLNNCGMNVANYSQTLIGWANYVSANSNTPASVTLGASGRTYHNTVYGAGTYTDAVSARAYLTGVPPSWTITGDALV
jgi:hypothetical protein